MLLGFSQFSGTLKIWFASAPADAPTIGGFLYLTVASLAVGMIVNAVRWALVDTLNSFTGLPLPKLNFSNLGKNVQAFGLLIEIHYRHYQFNANMFIATAASYICFRLKSGSLIPLRWMDLAFLFLEGILFATSRDTIRKYFTRSQQLLGEGKKRILSRSDRPREPNNRFNFPPPAPAPAGGQIR